MVAKKKHGEANIKGTFYDSSKCSLLTKVIDDDFLDQDFDESESDSMDVDDSDHEQTPKKPGRPVGPTKTWEELTNDRKLKRSQKAYNAFLDFCKEEKIEVDKGLFYMGRRHYLSAGTEDYNYEKGQVFDQIYKGKEFAYRHTLTAKQGKYLTTSLELGREKWQTLRKFLDPFLGLPSPDKLRIFQNQIVPKFEPTINEGLWLPLPTLV